MCNKLGKFFFLVCTLMLIGSCNKEFHTVGGSLFEGQQFVSGKSQFPVYTYQKQNVAVQSDGLPLAQLGKIEHPVFGISEANIISALTILSNPRFGRFSQGLEEQENPSDANVIQENEQVTDVYLEIPFFVNQRDSDNDGVIDDRDADPQNPESDSDNDGITDIQETNAGTNPLSQDSDQDGILDSEDQDNSGYDSENNVYEVDSIYGNRFATFNLKVYELTYYLNELDPANNFESREVYYSNQDLYDQGFVGEVLANHPVTLDFEEVRINHTEDNPETEVDETTQVKTRLTPRVRVPLAKDFFQKNFIDLEGSPELESTASFQEHFKGLIIRTDNFSDDLYMLLDMNSAIIRVKYHYDSLTGGSVTKANAEVEIKVNGLRLNILKNSAFDQAISDRVALSNQDLPVDKIYVHGGNFQGSIRLFSPERNDQDHPLIEQLRNNSWLINEATIVLYVDSSTPKELLPQRLYLYNLDSGEPLSDYGVLQQTSVQSSSRLEAARDRIGGVLELDEGNNPLLYRFRITDHVFNLLREGAENVEIGLVVTSNVNDLSSRQAIRKTPDQMVVEYPQAAILNPLGVILIGSNASGSSEDKVVELEITYTQT